MTPADRVAGTAAGIVITGWIAFVIAMARRPKPPGAEGPARRDRWSMLWIAMQSVSYAVVWSPRHWGFANRVVADARPWGIASVAWLAAIAVAVFTLGTALRVRAEETLLRAAFGATFDAYAKRVPAVVPRPGSQRV